MQDRNPAFPIPDEWLLDGTVNLYQVIRSCLELCIGTEGTLDRFFLGVKKGGSVYGNDPSTFFTKQHLVRHSFMSIVKRARGTLGLIGELAKFQLHTE